MPTHVLRIVLVGALAAAGCGAGEEKGTVTGKVKGLHPQTNRPQALAMGRLHFWHLASDRQFTAAIQPDGTYAVEVPLGEVKVFVESPRPEPDDVTDPPDPADPPPVRIDPRKWIPVPERFQQMETTPLKLDVRAGEQKRDLDLR